MLIQHFPPLAAGGFGAVRLGRFIAESYYATADYVSMHNHDTGSSSDAFYAYVMPDASKIAYRTPTLGGLTVDAAVALHEQAVGGKNASLGEMISNLANAGVSVPGGFATTAQAYRDFLEQSGLNKRIHDTLATLNVDDVIALAAAGNAGLAAGGRSHCLLGGLAQRDQGL